MQKCSFFVFLVLSFFCTNCLSFAQDVNWLRRAGDNNSVYNYGTSVAIDHNHNTIVTGAYSSGCIYGNTTLSGPGSHHIFLSRYNSSGNLKWVHTIGGNDIDEAAGVACDHAGNIYVAGNMQSPVVYFDAVNLVLNANVNGWNGFVAKYSPSGNFLWVQSINGTSDNKVESITTDADGNVIIGGYFTNSASFQGTQLRGGIQNIFLAKYSPAGMLQWATAGKSNNNCFARALTADTEGNIYVTGKISGDIAFNTNSLGVVYDQLFNTSSVPGNFYTSLPNAAANFTTSGLQAAGGVGDFNNFLYYNYYSNLENFKLEANLKVTASGAGVGLGKYCGKYARASFPLSVSGGNQVYFYNSGGGSSLSTPYNVSIGDSINISLQRNYDTMSATLINLTRHYTVSTGFRYLLGPAFTNTFMPNNGFYAMFFLGGSQTVYENKLSSTENRDALCAITGNSITTGYYSGGYGHRFSDVLYNNNPYLYDVNAGAGDFTYQVLLDTPEMISLHPKYVLINIGVNDAGSGTDSNIYQTEYAQIVSSYIRNGIIPVADLLVPIGGAIVDPFNRRIKAVAAANGLTVVDITTALADTVTGYMQPAYNSGDNVHPTAAGNTKIAQTIAAQAPFVLSDTTSWGITHTVITLPGGNDRVFIAKYNSSGVVQWVQADTSATATGTSPNNNYSCGNAIALDNAGNVYIGGSLLDATLPVVVQDAFIEKYTNNGDPVWQKRWGGNAYDAVQGLATNAKGYPYAIGNYGGNITIGGTALPSSDLADIFYAKFDTTGNPIWVTNTTGHGNSGNSIAADPIDPAIAMTGSFNNSAAFGNIGISSSIAPSVANYDIMVVSVSDDSVPQIIPAGSTIRILPNPNKGIFIVRGSLGTTHDDEVFFKITDLSGHVIYTAKAIAISGQINEQIQISHTVANGTYLLSVISGTENKLFHIVLEQ